MLPILTENLTPTALEALISLNKCKGILYKGGPHTFLLEETRVFPQNIAFFPQNIVKSHAFPLDFQEKRAKSQEISARTAKKQQVFARNDAKSLEKRGENAGFNCFEAFDALKTAKKEQLLEKFQAESGSSLKNREIAENFEENDEESPEFRRERAQNQVKVSEFAQKTEGFEEKPASFKGNEQKYYSFSGDCNESTENTRKIEENSLKASNFLENSLKSSNLVESSLQNAENALKATDFVEKPEDFVEKPENFLEKPGNFLEKPENLNENVNIYKQIHANLLETLNKSLFSSKKAPKTGNCWEKPSKTRVNVDLILNRKQKPQENVVISPQKSRKLKGNAQKPSKIAKTRDFPQENSYIDRILGSYMELKQKKSQQSREIIEKREKSEEIAPKPAENRENLLEILAERDKLWTQARKQKIFERKAEKTSQNCGNSRENAKKCEQKPTKPNKNRAIPTKIAGITSNSLKNSLFPSKPAAISTEIQQRSVSPDKGLIKTMKLLGILNKYLHIKGCPLKIT